jgi:hypothetical protein
MTRTVPTIYVHGDAARPLPWPYRLLALLVAGGCLAILVIGATLQPDPRGVGTHEAMGFNRCEFLARTGVPCPSCGMTTSVSHFAHGNILASIWVQPFGFAFAVLTAAAFWVALYMGLSGKPALRLLRDVPGRYYLVPLFALAVIGWGWKMFIVLRGLDGWKP